MTISIDIRNFLRFIPESPEYLQVCNGLVSGLNVINVKEIINFMVEENKSYCRKNKLCEVCHRNLVEKVVYEEG